MVRASQVVRAIQENLWRIEDHKLLTAPKQINYEAEILAEQFGDAILGNRGARPVAGFAG